MDPTPPAASSTAPAAEDAGPFHVLTPGLLAGFAVVILTLLAAVGVGLNSLRDVHDASEAVAQTYSTTLALQNLMTTVVDAETGERGFIITGRDVYLEPYESARRTVKADLARVSAAVGAEPAHHADFDLLAQAVATKLLELDEAIARRRTEGFAAGQAAVASTLDRRSMDGIRAIVTRMEARADALLSDRRRAADRSYRTARLIQASITGGALVAVVALFMGTLRYGHMRLRATRAAEAQQALLREALQQKDDFVALVSHELRSPVSTIAGWARMLEGGKLPPGQAAEAVAVIERTARSLRELTDNLMDTTQMVTGRTRLDIDTVRFDEVVRDSLELVRLAAANKGVRLETRIDGALPAMRGDAARLKQVVSNLLTNAIKFTPKDGRVTVVLASAGDALRLEVHDTGGGIPAAFLPHVFDRYRQASASSGPRGLGLGLAIVRHLVELHGGRVTASSAGPGLGSTFTVELPTASREFPAST